MTQSMDHLINFGMNISLNMIMIYKFIFNIKMNPQFQNIYLVLLLILIFMWKLVNKNILKIMVDNQMMILYNLFKIIHIDLQKIKLIY